jgi:aldose 1-epimerase
VFADPEVFPAFKESVNKVLPFIKEATAKERAMMGNKSASNNNNLTQSPSQTAVTTGSKRKRDAAEAVNGSSSLKGYFFAKFLTSPDLLDLEVCGINSETLSGH